MILKFWPRWPRKRPLNLSSLKICPVDFILNYIFEISGFHWSKWAIDCLIWRTSEHVVYKNCFQCQNKNIKQFLYTTCSELVFFLYWSRKSMNNLLPYCGLTDARMSASEKYLSVTEVGKPLVWVIKHFLAISKSWKCTKFHKTNLSAGDESMHGRMG